MARSVSKVRYLLLGAILLMVVLVGGGLAPAAAQASDPIPAGVIVAIGLPGVDNGKIQDGINVTLEDIVATVPSWACVNLRPNALDVTSLPIQVVVTAQPGPSTEQFYVTSAIAVRGQDTQKSLPSSAFLEGRPIEQALLTFLEPQVRDLAASIQPCQVKGKLHASLNRAQGGLSYAFNADGEADLTLQSDGSFDTTTPLTVSEALSWPTPCPAPTVADTNPSMHLAGGYRQQDSTLVLRQMQFQRDAWTYSSTCTLGPVSVVCTYDSQRTPMGMCTAQGRSMPFNGPTPILVGDILSGAELTLDLSDGASVDLPAPPGTGGAWEASLQLAYPGN